MIFLFIWLAICTVSTRAHDHVNLNFSLPHLRCNDGSSMGIQCDMNAHDRIGKQGRYEDTQSVIQLTSEGEEVSPYFSRGYVFYKTPVRMRDSRSGRAASFSTSFKFRIVPVNNRTIAGDGIAFVMFENGSWRGDPGVTLGVYKGINGTANPGTEGTKTFCVEYDTVYNPEVDPTGSDNHVGVNLERIKSKKTAEVSDVGLDLKGAYNITTWIDYNFTGLTLEVRIANGSRPRPLKPLLTYSLNLYEVVGEYMSVGFSSSTGSWIELHELHSWNFTLSGLPQTNSHRTVSTGAIVAILVAGVTAVFLIFASGCFVWRSMRQKQRKNDGRRNRFQYELSVVDMPFRFTYKQLSAATNSFTEASKLGQGGSGSVYRGQVTSQGTWVAIKKVVNTPERGEKEFLAEVSVLSQLRHRNLVKLLGFCSDRERGNYLVVYELMPRGSLDKLLHTDSDEVLSWAQRVAIVRDVAAGLAYLHVGTSKQVIHRDIKSSNVMLDETYSAKLGDFGLAQMIDHFKDATSIQLGDLGLARMVNHFKDATSVQLAGTFGYMAPEAVTGSCTDKSDVYAFGVLILEIVSARRPIDSNRPLEEMMLVDWVWTCHLAGGIATVADPRLAGRFSTEEMTTLLQLGLLCSHPDPEHRPSMTDVELILAGYMPLPDVPSVKPVCQIPDPTLERFVKEMKKRRNQQGDLSRSSNMSAFSFFRSSLSGSASSPSHVGPSHNMSLNSMRNIADPRSCMWDKSYRKD